MPRGNKSRRRPGQEIACGWCGRRFKMGARGRIPQWCSPTCRQRAWEQRRAAESGRAATKVVDRVVEYERVVYVVESVEPPSGVDWSDHLAALTRQVESGRYYDRDLPTLAKALDELLRALARRRAWHRPFRRA